VKLRRITYSYVLLSDRAKNESMGKVLRPRPERINLPERKGFCLSNSLETFLLFFDKVIFTLMVAILNMP
jgi:hypothetical protein